MKMGNLSYNISRLCTDNSWAIVCSSEMVVKGLTEDVTWQSVKTNISELCSKNQDLKLKIEILILYFDYINLSRDEITKITRTVGECEFTLAEVRDKKNVQKNLMSKGIYIGQLIFFEARTDTKYTFLDYVFGKCELLLTVAVDFTKSNGDSDKPESLHYLDLTDPTKTNEYIDAIRAVGDILIYYDTDKAVPILGFGAKIPPLYDKVSHCFSLVQDIYHTEVSGIEGILEAYRKIMPKVKFHGPTHLAEILKFVNDYSSFIPTDNEQYFFTEITSYK